MPTPPPKPFSRAQTRALASERRELKREKRRAMLDAVVAGMSHDEIAEHTEVSVATVRREIDRALAVQAEGSAQRYIATQLARLNRAMLVVTHAMDLNDLRSIPALATLLGEFDRYQGLAAVLDTRPPGELQKQAPKRLKSHGRSTK